METKNRVIKLTDNAQLLIKIVIAIATIGGGGGTVFAAKKVGEKYFPEQMEQIREVLGIDEKATPELISEKEKVIQDILERTISEVDNTILPELQEGSDITIWYEDNEKDAYKKIKSEHAISGLPVEFQEGDGITTTYTGDERKAYEDLKNKHEEKREEEENKRESELKEQLRDLEKIRNDFHNGSKAQKTAWNKKENEVDEKVIELRDELGEDTVSSVSMKKIGELINEKFRINQEQSKNLQEENESLKTLKDDFTIIKEKFGELEKKGSVDEEYKKQIFSKLETMVEKAVTEKMPVPQTPITPKTPAWFNSAKIEKKIEEVIKQQNISASTGIVPAVSLSDFEALKQEIEDIKKQRVVLATAPIKKAPKFDLKKLETDKGFKNIFAKSILEYDYKSAAPTGELLNEIFKEPLQAQKGKPIPSGFEEFNFPESVIEVERSLREWIETEENREDKSGPRKSFFELKSKTGKPLTGYPKDNSFDTANPQQLSNELKGSKRIPTNFAKVALGTGVGKSTFFLRCLAHRQNRNKPSQEPGATLVVPYKALVDSVLGAHNRWLSLGKDTMKDDEGNIVLDPYKRVTVCPICKEQHTAELDGDGTPTTGKYETVPNGPSEMINVFTWWEFLEAYNEKKVDDNGKPWIKPWVVFDEAHTDLPPYAALIRGLTDGTTGGFEAMTTEQRGFNMLEMSATFSDLPRSKKLTGKIEDYYVTDFKKFMAKNQKAFQKKTIVFCDDMKKLNLKPLDDKTKKKEERVKYLILDDALKDYATDLVRNLKPPLLVFANRDYSVGFSFGDVNVISTGISRRTIVVDDKGNEKVVGDGAGNDRGVNDIADILQQRGRAARDPSDEGIHGALIPAAGKFKLDSDYMGKTVESYLKKKLASGAKDANLKKVIALAKVERRTTPLSKEKGNLYLRQILVKSMKECLDNPSSLFNLLPSEAGKREAGEFIFQNKLMKYFDEGQLKDMLIKATEEAITNFSKGYKWYKTPQPDDDYIFDTPQESETVGFLFQAREEGIGYSINTSTDSKGSIEKLVITFNEFEFDEDMKDELKV